jgi:uncharacterized protein
MKQFINLLLTSLLILSFSLISFSMDLNEARNSKKVVELPTGYLEAKDPTLKSFVDDINSKRKKAYEDVAEKTRTSVDVVGARAHEKIKKDMGQ